MSRPVLPSIQSGTAGWDGELNDIIKAIVERPFPGATVLDVATLTTSFDPALYENCTVVVQSPTRAVYTSDGTNWIPV